MAVKTSLSILLPVYNAVCLPLVQQLSRQAERLAAGGLSYEIIVADDGSTTPQTVLANQPINQLPACRYVVRSENVGRAAIRNFLAAVSRHEWLLFLDDDFLRRYLERPDGELVIDGGVSLSPGSLQQHPGNLRCRYEAAATDRFSAAERQRHPYHDFHTANFLVSRATMLAHPFDERFRRYGYEDVLFGKQLRQAGIAITHIDNPVGFTTFETNDSYVSKTEEGMQTLHQFRSELRGYSRLLTAAEGIHLQAVRRFIRLWHRLFGPLERRQLCGSHPSLRLFKLYKLGYYLTLTKND